MTINTFILWSGLASKTVGPFSETALNWFEAPTLGRQRSRIGPHPRTWHQACPYHDQALGDLLRAAVAQLPKVGPVVLLAVEAPILLVVLVGE